MWTGGCCNGHPPDDGKTTRSVRGYRVDADLISSGRLMPSLLGPGRHVTVVAISKTAMRARPRKTRTLVPVTTTVWTMRSVAGAFDGRAGRSHE
jgi:hypothetical protein